MDLFSVLPDELVITILSLLPTLMATRTSVLSRRFRHLWKASPSADLYFSKSLKKSSIAMAKSVLLMSHLLHLDLEFHRYFKGDQSFISSLPWPKGLCHLTINGKGDWKFGLILLSIFSSCISLESLSIHLNSSPNSFTFPSLIAFTRLKGLSIDLGNHNLTAVKRLLSELSCLEHLLLYIFSSSRGVVYLSSLTIKKLELLLLDGSKPQEEPFSLRLSMPSLYFLSLTNHKVEDEYANGNIPFIYGDGALIRKAVVTLGDLCQKHITAVAQLLNFILNVEHLTLYLKEHRWEEYPFPVLMEPAGKKLPTFPNLKHLDMSLCFYESNFEAVVTMLHHSTALESLKLHHKVRTYMHI
ncbi:FBD-associated F-box protein At5g56370-like [Carex rostrata]